MNNYNTQLLVEAKHEYTNQLILLLKLELYNGIKSMYDAAYQYCIDTKSKKILKNFQKMLETTPKWSNNKLNIETERIKNVTNCDFLEDLLTAVFVSHVKVLSSIKYKNVAKNLELQIPTLTNFIHKVYIECAREFWKKPFLFDHRLSNIDIQRNIVDSDRVISESIKETIRKLLPVKDILKEYLGGNFSDESYDNIDFNDTISNVSKTNIRKILKLEIENSLQNHTNLNNNFSQIEIKSNLDNIDTRTSSINDLNTSSLILKNNLQSVSNNIDENNNIHNTDGTPNIESMNAGNIHNTDGTPNIESMNAGNNTENISETNSLLNNTQPKIVKKLDFKSNSISDNIENNSIELNQESENNKSLIQTILTNKSYTSVVSDHLSAHLFDDNSVNNM